LAIHRRASFVFLYSRPPPNHRSRSARAHLESVMIRISFLGMSFAALVAYSGLSAQEPDVNKSSKPPKGQPVLKNQVEGKNQGQPVKAGEPEPIKTKEGKTGWKVTIPGNRPLATPALADGKLFLGGGFGSHEFYAFDAKTGKTLWVYQTGDDGPTAA